MFKKLKGDIILAGMYNAGRNFLNISKNVIIFYSMFKVSNLEQ